MIEIKKIQGVKQLQNQIKSLADDKIKRREILKILKRQSKPLLKKVKEKTPVADNAILYRDKIYYPGDLKKSMAIKTSPMKHYPNVLIGPRIGTKQKYDGFYAFFIQFGYRWGKKRVPENDFIAKSVNSVGGQVEQRASKELEKYIYKKAKNNL